jgi:hypothetical protein
VTTPQCHSCLSTALPFAVRLDGGTWRHACGANVCPACGGVPAPDDALCGACRSLASAIAIDAADVVRRPAVEPPHGR